MAQDKGFVGGGAGGNTPDTSQERSDGGSGETREGAGDSDADAHEAEARRPVGAGIGGDPGGPGGMGGVRGGAPNPDHRPNGGVSPIQHDQNDD